MKGMMVFLILFMLLVAIPAAYAHPPSDIKINFDSKTRIFQAIIIHNTSNPLNHYIKKVDIGINGKEIIVQSISMQDNFESQTVSYFIPDIKNGDVLSVEGYCSLSGKLEKEIKVNIVG